MDKPINFADFITHVVNRLESLDFKEKSDEVLQKMHDIAHQELEIIGPALLAKGIKKHLILDALDEATDSHAQEIAILRLLHEVKAEKACDKCINLSERIYSELREDLNRFIKQEEAKEVVSPKISE